MGKEVPSRSPLLRSVSRSALLKSSSPALASPFLWVEGSRLLDFFSACSFSRSKCTRCEDASFGRFLQGNQVRAYKGSSESFSVKFIHLKVSRAFIPADWRLSNPLRVDCLPSHLPDPSHQLGIPIAKTSSGSFVLYILVLHHDCFPGRNVRVEEHHTLRHKLTTQKQMHRPRFTYWFSARSVF